MHEGSAALDARSRPARFSSTKFTPPEPSTLSVERPHLVTRVEHGLVSGLSLVVGSAGAGKTSVLRDWAYSDPGRIVCWMNVDDADSEPVRFWQAFVRSVQTRYPGFGEEVIDLVVLDRSVEPDTLEMLLEAFDRAPSPISVVVDDLHLTRGAVDALLRRLINRRPTGLHLIIGSRVEPAIDLGRLRAGGQISEVRDSDLMLDGTEAATLLSRLGVEIDDHDLAVLMDRTEGWAAGVHLAGVALRETDDPEGFVDRLSKSNQVLSHYLTTQVFDAQPVAVQRFLLDTCIVDELTPELAAVLSGGSSVTLFDIEAANLLLLRNSSAAPIFHYHHLLAELLRLRLRAHEFEHERHLHQLAAEWYSTQGESAAGFRHLWRAGRRDEALRLLDDTLFQAFWANELPPISPSEFVLTDDDVTTAPGPSIGFLTSLVMHPFPVQAGLLADRIDRLAGAQLTDRERVTILCIRTLAALARLNVDATIEYGEAAHSLGTAVGVRIEVADATAAMLVRAYAWSGDLELAELTSRRAAVDPASPMFPIEHNGAVAVLELMRGRLGSSIERAQLAIDAVIASRMTRTEMQLPPKSVLGSALLERGDIMAAEPLLREVSSIESLVRIPSCILAKVALSRLWRSRGDIDVAAALLDTARQIVPDGPGTRPFADYIDAQKALFLAGIGDLESSARVAEQLTAGFRRDHVEARLLITRGDLPAARERLVRMQQTSTCLRTDLELAITKLALATAEGAATDDLAEEVIGLAAQEGFVFALAESGGAVFEAIRVRARRMPRTHFVDVLLRTPPHSTAQRPIAIHAPDVLSERERIVLRYIATSMSYREIADELYISVNTVKSHVKSVIRKMQASSRAEAIARARELRYL